LADNGTINIEKPVGEYVATVMEGKGGKIDVQVSGPARAAGQVVDVTIGRKKNQGGGTPIINLAARVVLRDLGGRRCFGTRPEFHDGTGVVVPAPTGEQLRRDMPHGIDVGVKEL
jgi:hypothetical protein